MKVDSLEEFDPTRATSTVRHSLGASVTTYQGSMIIKPPPVVIDGFATGSPTNTLLFTIPSTLKPFMLMRAIMRMNITTLTGTDITFSIGANGTLDDVLRDVALASAQDKYWGTRDQDYGVAMLDSDNFNWGTRGGVNVFGPEIAADTIYLRVDPSSISAMAGTVSTWFVVSTLLS